METEEGPFFGTVEVRCVSYRRRHKYAVLPHEYSTWTYKAASPAGNMGNVTNQFTNFPPRYLDYVLTKNAVVNETNRGLLVETLRSIAEILIWGDQNDSRVFEYVF